MLSPSKSLRRFPCCSPTLLSPKVARKSPHAKGTASLLPARSPSDRLSEVAKSNLFGDSPLPNSKQRKSVSKNVTDSSFFSSSGTQLLTPCSITASASGILRAAEYNSEWKYAYAQLRQLLPHSEKLAPWQNQASLLMTCADVALRIGEAADACTLAIDAVDLHVAVSCDGASINARILAGRAMEKAGRRTEGSEMLRSACKIVENGAATPDQTATGHTATQPLDAAVPFVEFAKFLESCGSEESRIDVLRKALKQCPTTRSTICNAHLLFARAETCERDYNEANAQYERAIASAADPSQAADVLAEAALFAQHKLKSVDRAVKYYNQLFDIRPPESGSCANQGELLLNAAVCFEHHPSHGCARAVGLYRCALSNFPPNSPNTWRIRLYLARAYSGSGQIDRAVEEFNALISEISTARDEVLQIDVNGVRGFVPLCEIHGHLALCLFQRVGDMAGAVAEYQKAFEAAANRKPAPPVRTLEWLHEGLGALCLRIGQYEEALTHLEEKIDLASRRNDPAVEAHIHAAAAYEALRKPESAVEVYKYLFDLPMTAMTRDNRLELTLRYAWLCHYTVCDYSAAVTLYLAALHLDADNPHTMVQAAWCMLQLPNHDLVEVEALYSSATLAIETAKHDGATPGQWDECYVLGECAVFHHDVTKKSALAEELYQAALAVKASDNFAQVAANYAVFLHYEKKETAQALSWFEAAIASNPRLTAATTLFADFLIHTNQLDRAVQELQKLLPTNRTEAWHKLGRIAERLVMDNSYDTAICAYCKALGAPDTDTDRPLSDDEIFHYCSQINASQLPIANDLVTMLHYKTRRVELVHRLYAFLTATFSSEAHLFIHYAKFSMDGLKKKAKAHSLFRAAISLNPSNVNALDHYAEFLARSSPSRLDAAEAVHLQSIRLNPNSAQAHFSYASFLTYVYKAPARAEVHFKKALLIDPTDSLTLCCYATFLESQAEQRGPGWKYHAQSLTYAEWMHREAVKLSPSNASHNVFMANFLWRRRRHAEAWLPLQTALQLEPGNIGTLRLGGMFLHDWYLSTASNGVGCDAMDLPTMAATAEALLKRALSFAPNDVPTLRALAKFLDEIRRDHATALSVDAAATQIELAEHDAAMSETDPSPSDS